MAVGKKITDLTTSGRLKDTDLAIVHDGNGTKRSTLTQLSEYIGTKFSNPNLLINPDFKINQRGATSYSSNVYTVDRWRINNGTVKTSSSGVTVTLNKKGQFIQVLENALNGTYTATIKVTSITGDCALFLNSHSIQLNKAGTFTITENGSITGVSLYKPTDGTCTINVEYIKLEKGSIATPFVAPNPAEELVKCKRYFLKLPMSLIAYGLNNILFVSVPEVMDMRDSLTIGALGDGVENYIRYEGASKKIVVDTSKCSASKLSGYVKVIASNVSNEISSKIVSLGFNNFAITIDAEIY